MLGSSLLGRQNNQAHGKHSIWCTPSWLYHLCPLCPRVKPFLGIPLLGFPPLTSSVPHLGCALFTPRDLLSGERWEWLPWFPEGRPTLARVSSLTTFEVRGVVGNALSWTPDLGGLAHPTLWEEGLGPMGFGGLAPMLANWQTGWEGGMRVLPPPCPSPQPSPQT